MSAVRFPNESPEFRAARDVLTQAEAELTRRTEEVAALRRSLPPGGILPEDYVSAEGPADIAADEPTRQVRLSELFGRHDTLLMYSLMYGPQMPRPCQMCTSLLDGLDGAVPDLAERAGFAVVATSPIGRIRAYARDRGWLNMRLVSSATTPCPACIRCAPTRSRSLWSAISAGICAPSSTATACCPLSTRSCCRTSTAL